jgi:hypothetical protein
MKRMVHSHLVSQTIQIVLVSAIASKDQVNDKTVIDNKAFRLVLPGVSQRQLCE